MKVIKKYTAIQLGSNITDSEVQVSLSFGQVRGSYYDETHPKESFDTEQEAIEWAYEYDPWVRWLIVPVVTFDYL